MQLRLGRMNCRRCMILTLAFFVIFVTFMYMVFFYHGSSETILANNDNRRTNSYLREVLARDEDSDVTRSARAWQKFMEDNNYVSIGDVYNDCDDANRYWLGKTALLPDRQRGGVTSKTFINVTFESPLNEGDFFLKVSYEGKDLYENEWDFCTMEDDEDEDERFVFCPYEAKPYNWIIPKKIPNYLPKGRYHAKAWITDADEKVLMCGVGDFVL